MMFASRSRSLATRAAAPAATLVAAVVLLAAGCDNKHIGRLCDIAVDPGMSSTATINPQALECPSRICLLADQGNGSTDTAALCTAECGSDDDCADGETGPKGSMTDHHCETGFACVVATEVGPFACRRMCVCRDFVNIDPKVGYRPPASCK